MKARILGQRRGKIIGSKGERFSRERGLLGKKKSTRNFLRKENNWNSNGKREGTRDVKLEGGTKGEAKMENRAGKKLESRSVYRKEIVPLLRGTLSLVSQTFAFKLLRITSTNFQMEIFESQF